MKTSQIGGWVRALAFLGSLVAALPAWSDVDSTNVERGPLAYITRFDGGGISVLDSSTEQEIAFLGAQSPEGVAMAPGGRPVYVADYGASRLLVIDDTDGTPQIVASIGGLLGQHPRAVAATPDGRKVKSTMHWVSSVHAISAEIRLYDKLFSKPDPSDVEEGEDVISNLNPNSLEILTGAKLEPSLANAKLEDRYQFERVGYFCLDPDSTAGNLVFNRTLPLKDSWARIEKKSGA